MYKVVRRLQEQGGSHFVTLLKIWVEDNGLRESDLMTVRYNGIVRIEPKKADGSGEST
jgi:hypothetical protein